MIIMVLTFTLGTIFGIIGIVSTDGVSVLKWVFGVDNLLSASPQIITNKTSAKYVNICLNSKNKSKVTIKHTKKRLKKHPS